MKGKYSLVFSDKLARSTILLSIVFILLLSGIVAYIYTKLPPLIPFLNSKPWGEERLYSSWVVLIIPPALVVVFIVNNVLSAIYYRKNTLLARILSFNSLLFCFLALLAFLQIFFLVF